MVEAGCDGAGGVVMEDDLVGKERIGLRVAGCVDMGGILPGGALPGGALPGTGFTGRD